MAAPPSKTLKDLNGTWVMSKDLSDNVEPALALQGISWFIRKAVGLSTVTLHVKQYEGPPSPPSEDSKPATHIEIEQTATGGIKGTTENRCLDQTWREHSDWMFGTVRGQSSWIAAADIDDPYLRDRWEEGDAEKVGPGGESHIRSYVESVSDGWTALQIWGFQVVNGARMYCRNIVVAKGSERVQMRLVYSYEE